MKSLKVMISLSHISSAIVVTLFLSNSIYKSFEFLLLSIINFWNKITLDIVGIIILSSNQISFYSFFINLGSLSHDQAVKLASVGSVIFYDFFLTLFQFSLLLPELLILCKQLSIFNPMLFNLIKVE